MWKSATPVLKCSTNHISFIAPPPDAAAANTQPGTPPPGRGLIPSLGLFTMTMLVIGGVIGSGIFRKPGVMAAQVGSPELLLLVWVIAGIVTLFGTLTAAEIAAMIPETGGQYVYFERIYGSFFAFLYGWAAFAIFQSGSISAVAYVCAEYSTQFIPLPELAPALAAWSLHVPFIGDIAPFKEFGVKMFAAMIIVALTLINYFGVRFGGLVQNIFTIAKLTPMLLLVVLAFALPGAGKVSNLVNDAAVRPGSWALVLALVGALQGAFWAYDGWNKNAYIAGEVKNPQRTLPLALWWGMVAVTGVYVLMNLAYAYVLPIEEMAKSKLVAADVADRLIPSGGKWIALAVMISTIGAANAIIMTTARVYFAMGQRGVFPAALGRVHPRFHTPGASLLAQGVWSCLLLFSGTFDTLTDTLIFVSWIFYAAGAYGLFLLRWREPETPRPFRVPGHPWVPAVFIAFALLYLVLTVYNDITAYLAARAAGQPAMINSAFGTALVLMGTPIFWFYHRRKAKHPP